MNNEGTWHGSKTPPKKPEPIQLYGNDEPKAEQPFNLENLGPIENEWELNQRLAAAQEKRDDPWRLFPVMLSAILSAWLIITAAEAIIAMISMNIATQQMEKEMKKLEKDFRKHLP